MNVWKYKILSRVEQDISLVRLVRFAHSWDILANTLEINFVFPHAHVLYKLRFSSQSLTLSVALRCFIRFSGWIFFKNKKKMWRRMVWNLRQTKRQRRSTHYVTEIICSQRSRNDVILLSCVYTQRLVWGRFRILVNWCDLTVHPRKYSVVFLRMHFVTFVRCITCIKIRNRPD